MSNHYDVLGLSQGASPEEVKQAYLRKAQQTHPDKFPLEQRDQATAQFQAISAAYQVLKDPNLRAEYDATLSRSLAVLPSRSSTARPLSSSAGSRSLGRRGSLSSLRSPVNSFSGSSFGAGDSPSGQWGSASYPQPTGGQLSSLGGAQLGGGGLGASGGWGGPPVAQGWVDPPLQNPFDLFNQTMNGLAMLSAQQSSGGLGRPSRQPSRVGHQDLPTLVSGIIGGQQVGAAVGGGWGSPPSPMSPPTSGWGTPPQAGPGSPWGRQFSGGVSPGGGPRGMAVTANLNEGERHANGDFKIRNQALKMQTMNDGSIAWNSCSVEVEYVSGNPYATPTHAYPSPPQTSRPFAPAAQFTAQPLSRSPSALGSPLQVGRPSSPGLIESSPSRSVSLTGRPPSPGPMAIQRSRTAVPGGGALGRSLPMRRSTSPAPALQSAPARLALTQGGEVGVVGMGDPRLPRSHTAVPGTRRLSASSAMGGRPQLSAQQSSPANFGGMRQLVPAGGGGAGGGRMSLSGGWR